MISSVADLCFILVFYQYLLVVSSEFKVLVVSVSSFSLAIQYLNLIVSMQFRISKLQNLSNLNVNLHVLQNFCYTS